MAGERGFAVNVHDYLEGEHFNQHVKEWKKEQTIFTLLTKAKRRIKQIEHLQQSVAMIFVVERYINVIHTAMK